MKIAYITAQMPWGKAETFLIGEAIEMKRRETDLLIIPRNPPQKFFHEDSRSLLENSIRLPLFSADIGVSFVKLSLGKILTWELLFQVIRGSRNPIILIKNLAVFPKAVYIAKLIKESRVSHIHCHWGSTTATMAYVAARIAGVPWSFTLHRWDIKEDNLLVQKASSAEFVRCISERGKEELLAIIGKKYKSKVRVIHMGVAVPPQSRGKASRKKQFTIAVPANLIEVKGHRYLVEAIDNLVRSGAKDFVCIFYGEGLFRKELIRDIMERGLGGFIKMPGALPHGKLIDLYRIGEIDCVVLPSISTPSGENEGIPVALMEAMCYGVPVISTNTGAIPELLRGGAGAIVAEKSASALAEAIKSAMSEGAAVGAMSGIARKRIEEDFNIAKNAAALLELMKKNK